MKDKWTGRLVGKMHNYDVTLAQLAKKLGFTEGYVSMVLNGRRKPSGARERFEEALNDIIQEKEHSVSDNSETEITNENTPE